MLLSSQRDNLRELRAMQNKDKIYAPEEFTLHGAFFCLLFYSATARHEQDTKCLRMASRNMDNCPGVFFYCIEIIAKNVEFYNFVDYYNMVNP